MSARSFALTISSIQAYIGADMRTPLGGARRISFFISAELDEGLKALQAAHGTPAAEAIRRALAAYLGEKGVLGTSGERGRASGAKARRTKGIR